MNFKYFHHHFRSERIILLLTLVLFVQTSFGQQQEFDFNDLSSFKNPGDSWRTAGNVFTDLDESNELKVVRGTGILVNDPDRNNGQDLYTEDEYGNIDLELDYLMAKGSNSGIYFQGQYELQLKDSWGVNAITSGENGGVYQRWDDQKPEGEKGYQGYSPRQNVSKAPGLWQHLEVSFKAPKFNAQGEKIENAKFIYVKLNGVTIHEDLELLGPTRGSSVAGEKPVGPIRIQGDHGAVAFRNMKITRFEKPRPELTNLNYKIYKGRYDKEPDYENLPPEAEGKSAMLTSDLNTGADQFLVRYTGELNVPQAGEYTFDLETPGGTGLIRVNEKELLSFRSGGGKTTINLPAGELPFEVIYSKFQDWVDPGLGLKISGEGLREYLISDQSGDFDKPVDPILVEAEDSKVLRSFMNIPGGEESQGKLLTHAVSVGHPLQLHYTYDLNSGTLAQIWRGKFLDATPMWYSRGNGTSVPLGSVLPLGDLGISVGKLSSKEQKWAADTTGRNYRALGYKLDQKDIPSFHYSIYGADIKDELKVINEGQGIQRKISVDTPVNNLHVRLANADKIEKLSDELFLIGDKEYYIRLDDTGREKPVVRSSDKGQELLIPLNSNITYTLLY
ncbi:uncharacterized protein DUF1080 [Salegentibacter sp. 24]|uniref:3-keto-disaccharide hydrolase n=1 Tax=Salegentibacter sp. 24 TaxID=2183986 RepID=UPI00105E3E12|nr:DUF1080 domain-containing protein [Salegentibacter sp. 24]TDN95071.1 uncharacterized protein DUF1080 [Salegentibacter sp. 24]